jgi:potassium/hydrogen antiporter
VSDTIRDAVDLGLVALVGLAAVMSSRFTRRLKVPTPALMLVAAAVAVHLISGLHAPPEPTVERVVSVALVLILFDGGMNIGWRRFRSAIVPITVVGLVGTFLTAGGAALVLHLFFGLDWYLCLLVATAIAPTDPAVVFSVLGGKEIEGRSGTILEGESGANDPVGIALMLGLIGAGALTGSAAGSIGVGFLTQMIVGGAVGIVSGRLLLAFMRVPLPSEALYPLRTLACVLLIYGIATIAHGSGFLAVLVAGILIGDAHAPYKTEIQRFHGAFASLGEIVAFVVLGLTVDVSTLLRADVWIPGLVVAIVVGFVIRPIVVGACLLPVQLKRNEKTFIVFAGLKGAVPILLGEMLREAHVPGAERLYGIVVVVVVFSVVVQGGATPLVARWLHVPMRDAEPEPWTFGVRLRTEPENVQRLVVAAGSLADGRRIDELDQLPDSAWISFIVRAGEPVAATSDTRLQAGDDLLVMVDHADRAELASVVTTTAQPD